MNKKILFISFLVVVGFSIAIYQYATEFQAEFAGAAGTKPANGHLWSEMECDNSGLCINSTTGKVGIGVTNPTRKLEVNGDISSTGVITATTNICLTSGVCLNDISSYIAAQPITGGSHSFNMCTTTPDASGYGELLNLGTTASPVWICQFDGGSCPTAISPQATWTQFQNWSATIPTFFQSYDMYGSGCPGCTTGSHTWSNTATESCSYVGTYAGYMNGGAACGTSYNIYNTGYATKTKIGCY